MRPQDAAISGQVVAFAICADVTRPEHADAAARGGATMNAASCFLTDNGYDADAGILQRYARNHGMLVMMANYGAPMRGWLPAGRSAIWSGDGSLLGRAPRSGEALVVASRSTDGWGETVVMQSSTA